MVGNVSAVAMPMRPRTITSSSREKPAARGGGNSMPSPFGRPGKANGLAPMHAGGEAADHLMSPGGPRPCSGAVSERYLHRARSLGFASRRHRRFALWNGATKRGAAKTTPLVRTCMNVDVWNAQIRRITHCLPQNAMQNKAAGRTPPPVLSLLCDAVYLQAGAPSLMAAPTGPASLTKMEHVTRGVVRLLFVIDASHPPPLITSVTRLFPVVGHQLTSPAAGVQATPPTLLVTLVLYLTESAKYASSAVTRLRRSDFIEAR